MRRRTALAVFGAVLAAGCHGDSGPPLLRVGIPGLVPPFVVRGPDGVYRGYDIEVLEAVAARLGRGVVSLRPWPDRGLWGELRERQIDLAAGRIAVALDVGEQFRLSRPYAAATGVLVTRPDTSPELRGRRAAWWPGGVRTASDLAGLGAEPIPAETFDHAVTLLRDGTADIVPADTLLLAEYRTRTGDPELFSTDIPDSTVRYTILARRDDPLGDQLDHALADLTADGTLHALSKRHFGFDVTPSE